MKTFFKKIEKRLKWSQVKKKKKVEEMFEKLFENKKWFRFVATVLIVSRICQARPEAEVETKKLMAHRNLMSVPFRKNSKFQFSK